MSDTPDVDAAAYTERGLPGSQVVHVDFARRIKREYLEQVAMNVDARAELERLNTLVVNCNKYEVELKANLETSLNHAADVSEILANLCGGLPFMDEYKHAPEAFQWAKDFRKRGEESEAARLKAEVEQATVWTAACDSANARVTALLQQVSDLNLRVESLQELNFELAANAARIEECCNVLAGVTDKLLTALPAEPEKAPA